MNRWVRLVGENRWTALMLLSVLLLYSFLILAGLSSKGAHTAQIEKKAAITTQELKQKEETVKEKLIERPELAGALTLGFLALLVGGVLIDLSLARRWTQGRPWVAERLPAIEACWGQKQVVQALVFLFFAEGCIFLLHVLFVRLSGSDIPEDLFLMLSSLLRDLAAAVFVLLLIHRRGGRSFRDLGLRREKLWRQLRLGVVAYVAVVPVLVASFIVLAAVASIFSYEPQPQNVVEMYLKPGSQPYLVVFTLFVAALGPVLEEIFFRGFAYPALRRDLGPVKAAMLTAAVFAAFHMSLFAFLPVFLLGLFLCYLYEATGSLVPSITAHVLHNTIMVGLTLGFRFLAG